MRTGPIAAAAAVCVLLAAGCNPFSGPLPGDPTPSPYFIQHLDGTGTYPLEIDLGAETRDVYLTFVNPDLSSAAGSVTVDGSAADRELASDRRVASIVSSLLVTGRAPTPEVITKFNQNPFGARGKSAPSLQLFDRPPTRPLFDAVDDTDVFYDCINNSVPATCRAVVTKNVPAGIPRTLNIWVADDCWIDGGTKSPRVELFMLTALADQFLKADAFNDIYDWVTGMLGPEWEEHPNSDLIPANDEITIFLCDIPYSPLGTIVGYYWSRDNFFRTAFPEYPDDPLPYSNQRVMFTIDAVMYATGDGIWEYTDPWPQEMYSTLAHEFQHMIHFYQRDVLRNAVDEDDTWINEMASLVVEDLISDKMGVPGPRGVAGGDGTAGAALNTKGRIPKFNEYNDISLDDWGGSGDVLRSYSISYAFGAWLARNYGGAALLNRLMKCPLTGPASIEDIVSQATGSVESFPRLLQRWSAAQVLSDATDAPPGYRYNTGTFEESTVNGNTYRLGSINLYNYSPMPYLYTRSTVDWYRPLSTSQALCGAAIPGTGILDWTLNLPDGVIATVVARP